MSLKEFRKNYGQNVSMTVCQTAYKYTLQGHGAKTSLQVAASIYAQKFLGNPLKVTGYRVEKELGCVRIYRIQTETMMAQIVLQKGEWDYNDRNMCIAILGENYQQTLVRTMEFPDDLIVSIYNHFGRYISVVALEGCNRLAVLKGFSRTGQLLAVNAIGYYGRYLDAQNVIDKQGINTAVGDFSQYLLSQQIEFKHGEYLNDQGFFPSSRRGEHINHYLERKQKELECEIKVAEIEIFGTFNNK